MMTMPGRHLALLTLTAIVSGCHDAPPGGAGRTAAAGAGPPVAAPPQGSVRSAPDLTAEAVARLLGADEDFAAIRALLTQASRLDPSYQPALLFGGVTDFFGWAKQTLTDPAPSRGVMRGLLTRSGIVDRNGWASFWRLDFVEIPHNEGSIKNSTPRADAWLAWLRLEVQPKLALLASVLDAIPSGFAYRFGRSGESRLGELFPDAAATEIDYGDVRALRCGIGATLAMLAIVDAYDWANVDINDFDELEFPTVDPIVVVETKYPSLGLLTATGVNSLRTARAVLRLAWNDYKLASGHIWSETPEQQNLGLLSVADRYFSSAAERTMFQNEEAAFRTWMQNVINAAFSPQPFTVTTLPDGTPISPNEQPTFLVSKFWQQGVQFRNIYLKTIVDPLTGFKRFGVTDPAQLTQPMYTLDGIVQKFYGVAPAPGDVQETYGPGIFAVRIDQPKVSAKVINGQFNEWGQGATESLIAERPQAATEFPHSDVGKVWVAIDAPSTSDPQLYVRITADLRAYATWFGDAYGVTAYSQTGSAGITHYYSWGDSAWGSANALPTWANGTGGIEVAIPLSNFGNDSWVELEVWAKMPNPPFQVNSSRESLFVKIK